MNKISYKNITQAAQTHRENLRRRLQHRLEVARASGNEKLIHQLKAEAAYLHF